MSVTLQFREAQVGSFGGDIYIMLKLPDYRAAIEAKKFIGDMPEGKPHVAELKRYRQKRSLDSNSYFWVLAGKLSATLGIAKEEIYRSYVKDIGDNFEIVPVKDEAKGKWIENWENGGLGQVCDDLGPCRHTEGYSNIVCYFGSSTYDSRQMSCLISLAVQDCKDQGIETLPPAELARMEADWDERTD